MFHGLVSVQILASEAGLGEGFFRSVVNFRGSAGPGLNNDGRVNFSGNVLILKFWKSWKSHVAIDATAKRKSSKNEIKTRQTQDGSFRTT